MAEGGFDRGETNNGIVPVAITQIVEETLPLILYNQRVELLYIVGVITKGVFSNKDRMKIFEFIIEDASGSIAGKKSLKQNETQNFSLNAYHCVYGVVKSTEEGNYLDATIINILNDLNQITTHMLEVALHPIRLNRLSLAENEENRDEERESGGGGGGGEELDFVSIKTTSGANMSIELSLSCQPETDKEVDKPTTSRVVTNDNEEGPQLSKIDSRLSDAYNKVLLALTSERGPMGYHRDVIQEKTQLDEEELSSILNEMRNEGLIISTTNDDTYQIVIISQDNLYN